MNIHIIIMAKNPFGSDVKTRLAKAMGKEVAQGVYARLLYSTLTKLLTPVRTDITFVLSLSSTQGTKVFKEAYPEIVVTNQCQGDIGTRMNDAFDRAFQKGAERALLIGTDLPGINWSILDQALDQINNQTIVLGPTFDGGYYLIGMASPGIDIFQDILWSSSKVLGQTIKKIAEQGYQSVLLSELQDIDTEKDLLNWQSSLH